MKDAPDAQDARHSRLLDAMPAIAWSASARTFRFNYINAAAEKVLGYPVRRWLDEPAFWTEHIHPEDRGVAMLCHNETLACRDHELVYRMIAADGRTVWLRDYVNVHSVDGEPVELFGVMVDITREREAELAWKESRENFRRMVELSPDCIGVQLDGIYVYVNKAYVQLLGAKDESEIVGRDVYSFIGPAFHDDAKERFARVATGETVPYVRRKYRRVDGTAVDVEEAAMPLRYNNLEAVQMMARDITDRVRDEEELRQRETRLQLLASGTHEAIWEWFSERGELWTNDACRRFLGGSTDPDVFFEEWLSRVHPDDRERAWAVVRHAIDDELPVWWHEYRLRDGDGEYRVVLDRGHTIETPDGERRVIGAMLDVTSLRDAERQRAAAEAKFRWIVEQSVVAVYIMSGSRFSYINNTGAAMLGYTPDELTGIDLATLLPGQDDPAAVFGGGPNVSRVKRKDGTVLHIACYPNEVTVDGETIIIGTATDITDSVRARHALEASERRYRELVEGVSDILYTVDEDGRFVSLSRSFERSTGYSVDEWLGRPFAELFRPSSSPESEQAGDGAAIREYELPARSGAVVTVEVVSQPRYVEGEIRGTIGMARDVTESRTIARKLEDAKRLSSLGQLAASLAHEFNNVLMGIQPFVEIIARNAPGTRHVTESVGHITRAISRGKRASQEILRFANPKEPQLFPIDAAIWLPGFLGQLKAALPAAIELTYSAELAVCFMRCDREHLEQVITNLVFNARDAIIGRGTIHVELSRHGASGAGDPDTVRISVGDDGPGIPPAMLERIFEPLVTTKRNGTGLGLAIARRLMERQGGTIAAENRGFRGSVFHVYVPGAEPAVTSVEPPVCAVPSVKRILLVEDDLSVGRGLEKLLTSEGFETTWVRAAGDAFEAARAMQPQVAIIDVNLPDGNGADLVPLLRAEHRNLPIVLSTGHVELDLAGSEQRILSLMKPYELTDLLAAIGNVTAG